jgi:hypothetical protein
MTSAMLDAWTQDITVSRRGPGGRLTCGLEHAQAARSLARAARRPAPLPAAA